MFTDFSESDGKDYDGVHSFWLPAGPIAVAHAYRTKLNSLGINFRDEFCRTDSDEGYLFVFPASAEECRQIRGSFEFTAKRFLCHDVGMTHGKAFAIISRMLKSINDGKRNR